MENALGSDRVEGVKRGSDMDVRRIQHVTQDDDYHVPSMIVESIIQVHYSYPLMDHSLWENMHAYACLCTLMPR